MSLERPRRYTPLKIEYAINLLEQEATNRIAQFESKKPVLLQNWLSEISNYQVSKSGYTFRIIQGSQNVFKFALMLQDAAEKSIDVAIKGNELMHWVLRGGDDSLEKQTSKQIIARAITEVNPSNIRAAERFLEFCDLRHITPLNIVPLVIIDGKEVLIGLNGNQQVIPENAIWTNHPDLVAMLYGLFNVLWVKAKSGSAMLEQVNRGLDA